ncbi:site-specific DNA-methyltransferase [Poseidonocella sp. HB161398]|uniref:site-specific DNA-methyltransferase n=1 Tax=Poseidonocella sp. HB161398 TaxID=2320855 RepID=UPI001108BC16|nr:DNA methyltransferase [Poseidonocella sp. HB161398]
MSRLTDLIARAKAKDSALGDELEREFKALASRRAFGLNFERHRPESVELPGRPVRRGDKVRILPPRGSVQRPDQRLWRVKRIDGEGEARMALVELIDTAAPEMVDVAVADLVVVAEFRDYIYPGLVSTGRVERGGDKPFHTVINGENFHVLEALTYTHRGKIDAIYIDPPYNTGARDWKYNNDYVESEDLYRHSKWLAFMERRLLVARELLNPVGSVLVVTIDEKEYLRLGLLLEQLFPEAEQQMVTIVINPNGVARGKELARVEEYAFFVFFGDAGPSLVVDSLLDTESLSSSQRSGVRWEWLLRGGNNSRRQDRPNLFFPIFIDPQTRTIAKVGETIPLSVDRSTVPDQPGLITVWPVRAGRDEEATWQKSPASLRKLIADGFARVGAHDAKNDRWSILYLGPSQIRRIDSGELVVTGRREDGSVEVDFGERGVRRTPKTVWNRGSHKAGEYGSMLVRRLTGDRKFPFPKSLYAVEDALRIAVAEKPTATILDFFSGSGTTAHAVMRLNRQDGGRRQCISVTNNEVAADEQASLCKNGLRPGDPDWEKLGICDYITKPRIAAAITGRTPEGEDIKGDYKFTDEFPMAEGFEENAEFFTLTYESHVAVGANFTFKRIAPLLWMRAGSEGRRIDDLPAAGWDVADTYGLLVDLDRAAVFCDAAAAQPTLRIAYVVTDDDRRFQAVARALPDSVEPVRLYESYLSNFRFSMGR